MFIAMLVFGIYGYLIIALNNRPKYSPPLTPGIQKAAS